MMLGPVAVATLTAKRYELAVCVPQLATPVGATVTYMKNPLIEAVTSVIVAFATLPANAGAKPAQIRANVALVADPTRQHLARRPPSRGFNLMTSDVSMSSTRFDAAILFIVISLDFLCLDLVLTNYTRPEPAGGGHA